MIAVLYALVGLFFSACGQRGALYMPVVPAQNTASEQKEATVPTGLAAVESAISSVDTLAAPAAASTPVGYTTGTPSVDVMDAPVFFEATPVRVSTPIAPPSSSVSPL